MRRIISVLIIIVVIAGISGAALTYLFMDKNSPLQTTLNAKVLVLTVDPSEGRAGPGAVDMAFVVDMQDGNLKNVTPIYPGGMFHPTASAPEEVKEQGLDRLVLHDTCWYNNTTLDAKLAQETVQYNTNISTDVVVMVKPTAIDAILESIGGVDVAGQGHVSNNSIEFLRDEQKSGGMSRGNAVESIAHGIQDASKDKTKRTSIMNAIIAQYNQGNIIVVPNDFAYKFITAESLNKVFG